MHAQWLMQDDDNNVDVVTDPWTSCCSIHSSVMAMIEYSRTAPLETVTCFIVLLLQENIINAFPKDGVTIYAPN